VIEARLLDIDPSGQAIKKDDLHPFGDPQPDFMKEKLGIVGRERSRRGGSFEDEKAIHFYRKNGT